jgi:hypothetical protein
MTTSKLVGPLPVEQVVVIDSAEWAQLESEFEVLETHSTFVAGDLLIVHIRSVMAAVEQPSPKKRTVRYLANREQDHQFVGRRLREYERMWDGRGCRINYFS